MTVIPEPGPPFVIVGKDLFDQPPVVAGMVPDLHVAKLMDHDIVDDRGRGHDQAPGEPQPVVRRAGPPAAPGIVDGNPRGIRLQRRAEITHPPFKMQPGLFLIPQMKQDPGLTEGPGFQEKFTARKFECFARIISLPQDQGVALTQIVEPL